MSFGLKMKVAIVGNCQARPLAQVIEALCDGVEVLGWVIVHLAQAPDRDKDYRFLEQADYILAQRVADNYPTHHVRTDELREAFPERLVTWPNLYFRGTCPDLRYLLGRSRRRLIGPLGEYHNQLILDAWRSGCSVASTLGRLRDPSALAPLLDVPDESLRELRQREETLDVRMSDFIQEWWRTRRLFFTFNHPSRMSLVELGRRLLQCISVPHREDTALEGLGEPLGRIVPPLYGPLVEALGVTFEIGEAANGFELRVVDDARVQSGDFASYSLASMVEASFRAYDLQSDDLPRG